MQENGNSRLLQAHSGSLQRTNSSDPGGGAQDIFALPTRQKSRSRDRRESRMFLVDGQLCWASDMAGAAASAGAGGAPAGFSPGKRSSSIGLMFGSSMDLSGAYGASIDSSGGAGSGSEELISYKMKKCREAIVQLKRQCWPMERKLQMLRECKLFIKQHQGELKQSKQARDVLASTSAIFERYWRHFRREMANFLVIITPWEMRIKKIESHFGSVVASYFTFLRWIFWLNLANSLVMVSFVMVPELIENVPDPTGMRKGELGMQRAQESDASAPPLPPVEFNPTLSEMWEFEGFLKSSPIFYGYYSNVELSKSGFWRNPLAFLMSAMLTYLFCFFCISRKLSQNTKMSRIGSKDDEYTFCWTVFVGWDFMIGNSETAYNKTSSLVMNLKEGILEEKEQTKDRDWSLITRRVFANLLTIMLIVASAYVVTLAVQRSENLPEDASLLQKNELQLVMSGIQFMFPPLFDVIGIIEKYHPRKALSWQLGRILFLDFLNFYTLMFSLFGTVDQMTQQLGELSANITLLRANKTYYEALFTTTSTTTTTTTTIAPREISTISSTSISMIENSTVISQNGSTLSAGNTTDASIALLNGTDSTMSSPANVTTTGGDAPLGNSTEYRVAGAQQQAPADTTNGNLFTGPTGDPQLASSTTMPSNSTTTLVVPEDNDDLPQATSSSSSSSSLSTLSTSAPPEVGTGTATGSAGAITPGAEQTTKASTKSPTAEDEDYPDLQNVLGNQPRRRRKRATRTRVKGFQDLDQIERDETVLLDVTSLAGDPTPMQRTRATHQRQRAGLPPIRDPYKRLGTNQQQQQVAPAPPVRYRTQPASGGGGDLIEEDEEEEPLEGRLEVRPAVRARPTSQPTRGGGVARPIGGKQQIGRVVVAQTTRVPADLNSDNDEDSGPDRDPPAGGGGDSGSQSPSTVGVARNPEVFVEPTTGDPSRPASESPTSGAEIDAPARTSSPVASDPALVGDPRQPPDSPDSGAGKATSRAGFNSFDPSLSSSSSSPDLETGAPAASSSLNDVTVSSPREPISVTSDSNATTSTSNTAAVGGRQSTRNSTKKGDAGEPQRDECAASMPDFKHQEILALNSTLKDKLKNLCWETMFGQEMVKMVVMDLVMTIVSAVSFEFMRACFVRYCNRFFFWDLERGFPGYQDFKIAENVLHLVNNQSTVWMGMFFAPGLPAINTVKLAVLMYVRSWAVLTCNIPHETVFKVSKSNNFYYWILLINLLICILPVAYAVTWIRPSWHCGPFGGECRMYLVVTKLVKQLLPPEANSVFRYITSPGAVIPILIALILIIYYLASTVSSSKEANKELKAQLKKDKEQESAVPEITNTTVVDAAPPAAAGAPVASPAVGGAVAAATPTAGSSNPAPAVANPMAGPLLSAPTGGAASGGPGLRPSGAANSTTARPPKSLLMPPPI